MSLFLLNDFILCDNLTFEACFLNDIKTLKTTTTGADSFTCLAKSTASWIANSIVSPEAQNSSGMGTANSIPLSSPEERLASVNRKKSLKFCFQQKYLLYFFYIFFLLNMSLVLSVKFGLPYLGRAKAATRKEHKDRLQRPSTPVPKTYLHSFLMPAIRLWSSVPKDAPSAATLPAFR